MNDKSTYHSGHFPHWLDSKLQSDFSIWDRAQVITLPQFSDTYTLHDSALLDLRIDPLGQRGLLIISWDTSWTGESIPYPPNPLLLIEFPKFYALFTGNDPAPKAYFDIIGHMETVIVPEAERERLLDLLLKFGLADPELNFCFDNSLSQTAIHGIAGDRVTIFHGAQVLVVCLDSETAEVIPISDLNTD